MNGKASGMRVALEGVVLLLAQNQKAVNGRASGMRVVLLLAEEMTRLELRVQAIALQSC